MQNEQGHQKLGISGRIARQFQDSAITPLIALVGLLLGILAVVITPKEEEPQIDVTFADVFIPFPGATPQEVENLVTLPAEQVLSGIKGIDTLYSMSAPGGATLIVVFEVGMARNDALVALYNQLLSHRDWLPANLGVGEPLVKPRGIDDVPIVSLTLWSQKTAVTAQDLTRVAHGLETELKRIPGTKEVYTLGRHALNVLVELDPVAMNSFGVTVGQITQTLQSANRTSMPLGLTQDNGEIRVQVGDFLTSVDDVRDLVVAVHDGRPVYLADVARVRLSADQPERNVWMGDGEGVFPAVTLAVAKQPGENAVTLARRIQQRVAELDNVLVPADVQVSLTRDYGKTAADKSSTLIGKLVFATSAVVLLVLLTMGARESLVVGIAIIVTLAITLFASWVWGFTLNRVSLFALIFSIGILVDDAIVVVENIHRHAGIEQKPLLQVIPAAVDEVGGPTILATLTVIAALLPMAFVTGLMGPYMSPIPINASTGMLISLVVAFVVSPWLAAKLLKGHRGHDSGKGYPLVAGIIRPFLLGGKASLYRWLMALGVLLLIAGSMLLPLTQHVVLKMLPFDNKSEFQVILDMPEGSSLEQTQAVLFELADQVRSVPEVDNIQVYAGNAAPMNFNGLVRHYFLREGANIGDIQVNLLDKKHRDRSSHEIALAVRPPLQAIASRYQARLKVVEVPPGPPVWSPIVAEVYGPSAAHREQAARQLLAHFEQADHIVDTDLLLPDPQQKWQLRIDRHRVARLGIPYHQIVEAVQTAIGGTDVSYLHQPMQKYPLPIRLRLTEADKVDLQGVLTLKLPTPDGKGVALSELIRIEPASTDATIMHKNMVPMVMVVGDMAGGADTPLYGMAEIGLSMGEAGMPWNQYLVEHPTGLNGVELKWDGEWKITYETFRDMGLAYSVGMVLIYLLVVAQFRSYLVPLIIMAPIPLTIIGVLPGHALLGAQFTATSMIGMIALAGIIVRNSILLVDFINHQVEKGVPFAEAVMQSGAVRAKPILLTALAAMIGAFFILDDPIFNGLAISLIFGILVSTLLTLVVIPVLYFVARRRVMEVAEG